MPAPSHDGHRWRLAGCHRWWEVGPYRIGLHDRPTVRAWLGLTPGWPPPGGGLPVGAHTSQFLATHVNLMHLDHFVKRELKVPAWTRYGDDMFAFGNRRSDLRAWRLAITDWLARERHLRLKHPLAPVLSCAGHLDALGWRLTRDDRRPLERAWRRFRRRIGDELGAPPARGRIIRLERSMAASAAWLLG